MSVWDVGEEFWNVGGWVRGVVQVSSLEENLKHLGLELDEKIIHESERDFKVILKNNNNHNDKCAMGRVQKVAQ